MKKKGPQIFSNAKKGAHSAGWAKLRALDHTYMTTRTIVHSEAHG
jgi:hypothetical protein